MKDFCLIAKLCCKSVVSQTDEMEYLSLIFIQYKYLHMIVYILRIVVIATESFTFDYLNVSLHFSFLKAD